MGNKGPLKVLNGTKLILDDHGNNLNSFRISLESFRSSRGPLLHKPVTGQELFFAVSYSKPVLVSHFYFSVVLNLVFIYFSGSTSPCEDKVVSGLAATYKGELWFKNDIWVSFDACSPDNIQNNSKFSINFVRNK